MMIKVTYIDKPGNTQPTSNLRSRGQLVLVCCFVKCDVDVLVFENVQSNLEMLCLSE